MENLNNDVNVNRLNSLNESEEKLLSLVIWIGSYFSWIILPILVYILKGNQSKFVKSQFNSCMNMLISYFVYSIILTILIGIFGILTFGLGWTLFSIIGIIPMITFFITILGVIDTMQGKVNNYFGCIEFFKVK